MHTERRRLKAMVAHACLSRSIPILHYTVDSRFSFLCLSRKGEMNRLDRSGPDQLGFEWLWSKEQEQEQVPKKNEHIPDLNITMDPQLLTCAHVYTIPYHAIPHTHPQHSLHSISVSSPSHYPIKSYSILHLF